MLTVAYRFPADPAGVVRSFDALTYSAAQAEAQAVACLGLIEILSIAGASGPGIDHRHHAACRAYDAAGMHG